MFSVNVRKAFFFDGQAETHVARNGGCRYSPISMHPHQEEKLQRFVRQLSVGLEESFRVIPGHPVLGAFSNSRAMFLKCCEVIERIDFRKTTGVDQAHEQIADVCSTFGLEEQRIFPMQDGPFEDLLAKVIIQWGVGNTKEQRQRRPVVLHVGDRFSQPGIGLGLFLF